METTESPTNYQKFDTFFKNTEEVLRHVETLRVALDIYLPSIIVDAISTTRNPIASSWTTGRNIYKLVTNNLDDKEKENKNSMIGWTVFTTLWIATGINSNLKRFNLIASAKNLVDYAGDAMPFLGIGLHIWDAQGAFSNVKTEETADEKSIITMATRVDYQLLATKLISIAGMISLTSYVNDYRLYCKLGTIGIVIGQWC